VEELQPKTKEDLIGLVFEVWETLEVTLINALIESMSKRIAPVIEKGGERIPF
jgi:hypothetical protein